MPITSLRGSLTDRREPVVRVGIVGLDQDILALVDTGYNQFLQICENTRREAKLERNPLDNDVPITVIMGDGVETKEPHYFTEGKIIWFEEEIVVDVLVWDRPYYNDSRYNNEIDAVIGTNLLKDCKLTIDFPMRRVEILSDR